MFLRGVLNIFLCRFIISRNLGHAQVKIPEARIETVITIVQHFGKASAHIIAGGIPGIGSQIVQAPFTRFEKIFNEVIVSFILVSEMRQLKSFQLIEVGMEERQLSLAGEIVWHHQHAVIFVVAYTAGPTWVKLPETLYEALFEMIETF